MACGGLLVIQTTDGRQRPNLGRLEATEQEPRAGRQLPSKLIYPWLIACGRAQLRTSAQQTAALPAFGEQRRNNKQCGVDHLDDHGENRVLQPLHDRDKRTG